MKININYSLESIIIFILLILYCYYFSIGGECNMFFNYVLIASITDITCYVLSMIFLMNLGLKNIDNGKSCLYLKIILYAHFVITLILSITFNHTNTCYFLWSTEYPEL